MNKVLKHFYDWDIFFKLSQIPVRRVVLAENFSDVLEEVFEISEKTFPERTLTNIVKMNLRRDPNSSSFVHHISEKDKK
jgi:hypothetical protein